MSFRNVKCKNKRRNYLIDDKQEELDSRLRERLHEIELEITGEEFFHSLLRILRRHSINKVVCLGLGHFSVCPISRVQLAFLLALTKSLTLSAVLQDPVFFVPEATFLRSLDFEVLEENLEGKFATEAGEQVLYFLPHCPKQLTNNLLWSNWSAEQLQNSVLVGNSFEGLLVHNLEKDIKREAGFVQRINEFTTELPLKVPDHFFDSFNDTSIHLFESQSLDTIPTAFWEDREEPQTPLSDLELISNQIEKL